MPTWARQVQNASFRQFMPTWGKLSGMAKQQSIGALMVAQRYAKMTPEERSEAARNAAQKRWAKEGKKGEVKKPVKGKK